MCPKHLSFFFQNQKFKHCACLEEEPGLAPPVGAEDGEKAGAPTVKERLLTAFEEVSRLKSHVPHVFQKVSMPSLHDVALRLVRMKTMGISSGPAMDLPLRRSWLLQRHCCVKADSCHLLNLPCDPKITTTLV